MKWLFLLCIFGMQDDVKYLSSDELQGRASGSAGYVKACEYIKQQCPIPVQYQKVGSSQNVIAILPGGPEVIVIGAHLDHMGVKRGRIYNGADDNASGSAMVLELARRFKAKPPAATLVFIWFTGEEDGFIGSQYYVQHPVLPWSRHVFMLNMDMVGHLATTRACMPSVPETLRDLYAKYPFAEQITLRRDSGSDQVPFADARLPVVFLHTGLHRRYHEPTDDSDTLNYAGMDKIADYATELIYRLAGKEISPYVIYMAAELFDDPFSDYSQFIQLAREVRAGGMSRVITFNAEHANVPVCFSGEVLACDFNDPLGGSITIGLNKDTPQLDQATFLMEKQTKVRIGQKVTLTGKFFMVSYGMGIIIAEGKL